MLVTLLPPLESPASSQAHWVAAGANGYAGAVNGRTSSSNAIAEGCGSQAGQFFCQFDIQRVILVV